MTILTTCFNCGRLKNNLDQIPEVDFECDDCKENKIDWSQTE